MSDPQEFDAIAMQDILRRERKLLLSGDLAKLSDLLPEKERLVAHFHDAKEGDAEVLDEIRVQSRDNERLLNAALAGLRSVTQRVKELQTVRSSLETYDQLGKRKSIKSPQQGQVEKRA
ncbi:hypothetical protein [Sulfitobacter sp. S190]|uniref:hypothetical protein n=1 Tax=Sulfitobacter sp. S190 TaxID=2867022 RepID=UPI0021A95E16|nr:hypothetical protein [Sulfitobacter sp. S190]UWR22380.1 hypothetical protein K3756_17235 [Sulfitobacter sp. S190]